MSDPRGGRRRGSPRKKLNPPATAMTELGHYMRQQRLTAGVDTMKYATKLVERAMRPAPGKPLDEDHLANVERGNSGVNEPMWREKGKPDVGPPRVYVPYELAEAYDTAFGADGYLADVYDWAWVRDHEHEQSPPRAMPPIPAELTLDAALRVLWDGFAPQDEVAGPLLAGREAAVRAAYPGWQDPARADAWVPAEGGRDRSAFVNELNEFRDGQLTAPGAVVSGSWPLRNMGEIPWRDRLLFRVSQRDAGGIHAPRFVPAQTPTQAR